METALSEEEQSLFNQMEQEAGGKEAKAADDAAAKEAADKAVADKATADAAAKAIEDARVQKTVPLEALHEARTQNKELKAELTALRDVVSKGDDKLQKFIAAVSKQAEAPAPKFEEDPAGALKHENAALRKDLDEIRTKMAGNDATTQQQARIAQFSAMVQGKEAAFAKANPDYFKAAEYVAQMWRDEFSEAGFEDADLAKMVFQKSLAITNQAASKEKDPAEAIYKIAKRYGFGKEPEKKQDGKQDAESKLKQIEKGQDAARKQSDGNGPDNLTLASLAQMDDDAIEKLVSDKDWWNKTIRRSPL